MSGSLRIGRIAGIQITIHYSWLIILVLLTGSLAAGRFPNVVPGLSSSYYVLAGLLASLLLFGSVLAHELGHSLVAQRRDVPVKSISLFIFGGIASLAREPRTPGAEFQIAIIGPIVSLVIGVVAWVAGTLAQGAMGAAGLAPEVLLYVGEINILLAVFNMIPGFPLDGGRVMRSIVWKLTGNQRRATRWASASGQVFALLFILVGVWQFFAGNVFGGLWIGFIGWFLLSAAQAARAQVTIDEVFTGVRVRDLMRTAPVTAPANISLQRLTDEYLLPYGLQAVVIAYFDYPAGIITIQDVMRVPRDRWGDTTTGSLATPINQIPVLKPDQMVMDALPVLTQSGYAELPVMEDERLVGMLSREQLSRALEVRQRLGVEITPTAAASGSPPDHTPVIPEDRRTATPGAL